MTDQNEARRELFREATGFRWTIGVGFVVDLLATIWFFLWLEPEGGRPMPVAGLSSALTGIGLEMPTWAVDFVAWLHGVSGVLLAPGFAAAYLLLLVSTYRRADHLYRPAAIVLLMLLFEMHGSPWPFVWLWLALAATAGVAKAAALATEWNRRGRRDLDLDYFGSRIPSRVLLESTMSMFPPIILLFGLIAVVRQAFTVSESSRLWQAYRSTLERLDATDRTESDSVRLQALLELSADRGREWDRRMIEHLLAREG